MSTEPRHIKLTPEMKSVIAKSISKDWSPEQIQGRLKSKGLPIVCFTTIYAYIKRDKAAGGELYHF